MHDAEIEGYFTNDNTRCIGGTQLFQAGIDRKLVKEATGHCSDAVDKYQLTSHAQRKTMSAILQNNPVSNADKSKIENVNQNDQKSTKSDVKVTVDSVVKTNSVDLNAKKTHCWYSTLSGRYC